MRWFRNIKPTDAFDTGQTSLGYSLQVALGLERFHTAHPQQPVGLAPHTAAAAAPSTKTKPISRGDD
jgi:hypothetical protein